MLYEPIVRGLRRACPKCSEGRLLWRNWKHWQSVTREGRRCSDYLVYYECDRCHCRVKILRGGMVREVDEREWGQVCQTENKNPGSRL